MTAARTRDDWILTHELIHVSVAFAHVRNPRWLSEGLATYVEPIVRAPSRAGHPGGLLARPAIDGESLRGCPRRATRGLEQTAHTWGRTYWGGALFCFVADVQIREQTKNARSLDDALRGIVATGDDVESHWTGRRSASSRSAIARPGRASCKSSIRTMGLAPGGVDLAAMWKKLGVRIVERGRAGFDDSAPLAEIRKAITQAPVAR